MQVVLNGNRKERDGEMSELKIGNVTLENPLALALTISIQISPTPCSLHNKRKGRSVTPAMGAKTKGFSNSTFPIFNFAILLIQ